MEPWGDLSYAKFPGTCVCPAAKGNVFITLRRVQRHFCPFCHKLLGGRGSSSGVAGEDSQVIGDAAYALRNDHKDLAEDYGDSIGTNMSHGSNLIATRSLTLVIPRTSIATSDTILASSIWVYSSRFITTGNATTTAAEKPCEMYRSSLL